VPVAAVAGQPGQREFLAALKTRHWLRVRVVHVVAQVVPVAERPGFFALGSLVAAVRGHERVPAPAARLLVVSFAEIPEADPAQVRALGAEHPLDRPALPSSA
jgi:hypothetical protein